MSTQPVDSGRVAAARADAQITASVKGLAASLDISPGELAELVGIDRATYYRRRKHGGWKASEIALIAARCRVSVGDIYSGRATAVLDPIPPRDPDGHPRSPDLRFGFGDTAGLREVGKTLLTDRNRPAAESVDGAAAA